MKRTKELDYTGYRLTGDGLFDQDIRNLGTLLNGVVGFRIWVDSKQLQEAYKKKFDESKNPLYMGFVGLGYDAVLLVEKAYISLYEKINAAHQYKYCRGLAERAGHIAPEKGGVSVGL